MPPSSPPSPLFLLSGLGMMAVAAAALLVWQQRKPPLWDFAALGAVGWLIGVALKFAWALPTNKLILAALHRSFGETAGAALGWLYIGLLTGVFECGATWFLVKRTRVKAANWDQSVAFGLGFGAVEAFLLGLASFIGIGLAILSFHSLPADAKAKLLAQTSSLASIPLPIIERTSAITCHVVSCILIIWAVQQRRALWFWLSFAYKTVVDGAAACGIERFELKTSQLRIAEFNAMFAVFVFLSLAAVLYLRKRVGGAPDASPQSGGASPLGP